MRKPKLRELKEAITALIKGPYTTRFPYKPHTPYERFRGRPQYYNEDCMGCGACAEVCPSKAIDVTDMADIKVPTRKFVLHYDRCIFCGQCQANCPTEKGVMLTNEFDITLFEREDGATSVEKELILCQDCKAIIGAKEHLIFLARKLGPIAYSSPLFMLTMQKELNLAEEPKIAKPKPPLRRKDYFRILCPKCRRETQLADEYEK